MRIVYACPIYIYQYIQVSSVLKYFNITSSTNNLFRLSYTYGGVCVPSPPFHRPAPSLSFKYHACVVNHILHAHTHVRARPHTQTHTQHTPSSFHTFYTFVTLPHAAHVRSPRPVPLLFLLVNTKSHSLNSSRRLRTPKADHSLSLHSSNLSQTSVQANGGWIWIRTDTRNFGFSSRRNLDP